MKEYRCVDCHTLLFKYEILAESQVDIEIKCRKCRKVNSFRIIKTFVKAIAEIKDWRMSCGRAE